MDNHHHKMFKPFKPPLSREAVSLVSLDLTGSDSEIEVESRPYKKRKLLVHTVEEQVSKTRPRATQAVKAPRKPLLIVNNPVDSIEVASHAPQEGHEGYYIVLWSASGLHFEMKY